MLHLRPCCYGYVELRGARPPTVWRTSSRGVLDPRPCEILIRIYSGITRVRGTLSLRKHIINFMLTSTIDRPANAKVHKRRGKPRRRLGKKERTAARLDTVIPRQTPSEGLGSVPTFMNNEKLISSALEPNPYVILPLSPLKTSCKKSSPTSVAALLFSPNKPLPTPDEINKSLISPITTPTQDADTLFISMKSSPEEFSPQSRQFGTENSSKGDNIRRCLRF